MAIIVNYASLKTAVADWLSRADLTSFIPNFIQNAENRIYREVRVRQMIRGSTFTIAANDDDFDIPADYLEFIRVVVNTTPVTALVRTTIDNAQRQFPRSGSTGAPVYLAFVNNSVAVFYPRSNGTYDVSFTYYGRTASMTSDADNPWLIDDASDLILYASLVESAPFIKDDARVAMWEAAYQRSKAAIIAQDLMERKSGSVPTPAAPAQSRS